MKLRVFLLLWFIFCNFIIFVHAEGPDYGAINRVLDFLETCAYDKKHADEVSKICIQEGFNASQIELFFVEDLKRTKKVFAEILLHTL